MDEIRFHVLKEINLVESTAKKGKKNRKGNQKISYSLFV